MPIYNRHHEPLCRCFQLQSLVQLPCQTEVAGPFALKISANERQMAVLERACSPWYLCTTLNI